VASALAVLGKEPVHRWRDDKETDEEGAEGQAKHQLEGPGEDEQDGQGDGRAYSPSPGAGLNRLVATL